MKSLFLALALFASSTALAAPFCVVSAMGEQCWYFSRGACEQAARGANGACTVNAAEVAAQQTGAPFCVVTGVATMCYYYAADQCRRAAAQMQGMCVVNR